MKIFSMIKLPTARSNSSRYKHALVLSTVFIFSITVCECQTLPKTLILTGNGNLPSYKDGYPPWIHEFQNEKVIEILNDVSTVDVTSDLSVLRADRLQQYDLIISNSIFLTPDKEQLSALYEFVANGRSYLTLHCGILSLLNWDRYEEFIGGIFIGGPSSVPAQFKVSTSNTMFWGYEYSFRKEPEHPISIVSNDFVIKDELYHFQPSKRDFYVIARAENLPVMWWHPVGKGKVMSLTLGHDEEAKKNPGYQDLVRYGVQWLTGVPLIFGEQPRVVSTRNLKVKNFTKLSAATDTKQPSPVRFQVAHNSNPEIFIAETTPDGTIDLTLSGRPGVGKFVVKAQQANGFSSTKTYDVTVVQDGSGNVASYHGSTATCSSNENQSSVFHAGNVLDDDATTRWSSAPTDSAWIAIDLQKAYNVKKIVLQWEASFAVRYAIEGSKDGKKWTTLADVSDGNGDADSFDSINAQIRYLRINATKRASDKWGYSLYDVKVYQ